MSVRVKVSRKFQIAVPSIARKKLGIQPGDHLIVDVIDGHLVVIPEPRSYTEHLRGLHKEIWNDTDAQEYVEQERSAWQS